MWQLELLCANKMDTVGVIGSYENCLKEKEVLNQEIKKLFAIKAFLDDRRVQTV